MDPLGVREGRAGALRSETEPLADGREITYYWPDAEERQALARAPEPAILVTGAAGYVAGPVVSRLLRAGHAVVALDNLSTSTGRTLPSAVHLVRASVGDAPALRHILRRWQIQAVFHFAADSRVGESMTQPLQYFRHNVREGLTLLEEVVAAGAPPLIFSSSAAVYGIPQSIPVAETAPLAPINPYGETKAAFERILHWTGQAHGLRWAALRYFNAAGADGAWEPKVPETHLIPRVLAAAADGPELEIFGRDYDTPDGTAIRDYIHVADLAEGHLAALAHLLAGGPGGVFNLGTGQGFSVADVVAMAEVVTGRTVRRRWAPRRAGDPPALVADPARARRELGWAARVSSLERIVGDAWRALEAAGAGAAAR